MDGEAPEIISQSIVSLFGLSGGVGDEMQLCRARVSCHRLVCRRVNVQVTVAGYNDFAFAL